MGRIDKFYEAKSLFQCPRCGKKIRFHAGGLVCKKEHTFDIAAKGYVNLLQQSKTLKGYDTVFFKNRRGFFQAGYYDYLVGEVTAAVLEQASRAKEPFVVLDAGCGEGGYSVSLEKAFCASAIEGQVLAFDIASDAIKVAAGDDNVKWMVADITNIPIKDETVDCIIDVFTPANYTEFKRVLKDEGILIKVVPGSGHLQELRQAAADLIQNKAYSNDDVMDYFEEHFRMVGRKKVTRTLPLDEENLKRLIHMTPLLFDVDKNKLDASRVKEITIEGEIIIGKKF